MKKLFFTFIISCLFLVPSVGYSSSFLQLWCDDNESFIIFMGCTSNDELLITNAFLNDLKNVRTLLERGADVNYVDKRTKTALSYAVINNNFDMTDALLEAGAEVNHVDQAGIIPLMYAIGKNNFDMVELLVYSGANVNFLYLRRLTPLRFATIINHHEIAELLTRAGATE